MREVKARIWDKENNKFWKDVNEAYKGRIEQIFIGSSGDLYMRKMDGMHHESTFPDRFEKSWYTGLKDKNGKEIYEGDVVKHKYGFGSGTGYVYYSAPHFGLLKLVGDGVCTDFEWTDFQEFEVIGNIYEHPHLLEGRESIPKEDTPCSNED